MRVVQISFASSVLYRSSSGFVYSLVPVPTGGGDGDGDGVHTHTQDCVRHVHVPQETRVNGAHSPDVGPDYPRAATKRRKRRSELGRNRGIVYIAHSSLVFNYRISQKQEINTYIIAVAMLARLHTEATAFCWFPSGSQEASCNTQRGGDMMRQKLKGLNTELDIAYS
ncbi:hypothetical protein C0Q70_18254 [Pomacea canaliculata]|uniref:Uncharacterized protein n=1 Tax=Pomacea canaliculata TaxID=400727 RepID=A0A2T7NMP6_POMCA|nr:hypothetical protein C0Q70_18254 [Pomacea canaliculata]